VFTTVKNSGLPGDLWLPSSKAHGWISCIKADKAQPAIFDSQSVQQEQEATRAKWYSTYFKNGSYLIPENSNKNEMGQVEVGRNWLDQSLPLAIF
jgi:hypothetical protein